jgi:hypothetical protein
MNDIPFGFTGIEDFGPKTTSNQQPATSNQGIFQLRLEAKRSWILETEPTAQGPLRGPEPSRSNRLLSVRFLFFEAPDSLGDVFDLLFEVTLVLLEYRQPILVGPAWPFASFSGTARPGTTGTVTHHAVVHHHATVHHSPSHSSLLSRYRSRKAVIVSFALSRASAQVSSKDAPCSVS